MSSTQHTNAIRTYRLKAGLSQAELGLLVSPLRGVNMSRFESGQSQPNVETALGLSVALGVPVSVLFKETRSKVEVITRETALGLANRLEEAAHTEKDRQKLLWLMRLTEDEFTLREHARTKPDHSCS